MKLMGRNIRPGHLLRELGERARLATAPRRRRVALVGDGAAWSIRDDQRHLLQALRQHRDLSPRAIHRLTAARHALLHVLNREALLKLDPDRVHPSNRVVLTWYHGGPDDPEFAEKFAALQRWLPRLAAVVTSCHTTRRDLIAGGVEPGRVVVVPLGVDLETFTRPTPDQRRAARQGWGVEDHEIAVGSFQKDGVGWGEGLEPKRVKGPDVFLEAMSLWKQQRPTDPLKVLLTGPARGFVKQGLDRLDIGWVHRQFDRPAEVVGAYHALDLYVIASRCEGGPKALLEAWASGAALVSSRVGMVADWLVDGQTGLSVEGGDAAGLAAACQAMTRDAALRERCVTRAAQRVKGLTWRDAAATLAERVYLPIMNGRPPQVGPVDEL